MADAPVGTTTLSYVDENGIMVSFGITDVSTDAKIANTEVNSAIREFVHVIKTLKDQRGTVRDGPYFYAFKRAKDANFIITMIYDSLKSEFANDTTIKTWDKIFRKSKDNQYKKELKKKGESEPEQQIFKIFLDTHFFEAYYKNFDTRMKDEFEIVAARKYNTQTQNRHDAKIKIYTNISETATKLAYMLRYSFNDDPCAKYKDDKEVKTEEAKKNWNFMLGRATRYLWLEYEEFQGFHRGIDITLGEEIIENGKTVREEPRVPIYAISDGEVIRANTWSLFVYDTTTDPKNPFTICYLHAEFKDHSNAKNPVVFKEKDEIKKGQQIGTESNKGYNGGVTTLHTHIEINAGKYSEPLSMGWVDINPYITEPRCSSDLPKFPKEWSKEKDYSKNTSNIKSKYAKVTFSKLKNYFSLNPYPYIDKIFEKYSQANNNSSK